MSEAGVPHDIEDVLDSSNPPNPLCKGEWQVQSFAIIPLEKGDIGGLFYTENRDVSQDAMNK